MTSIATRHPERTANAGGPSHARRHVIVWTMALAILLGPAWVAAVRANDQQVDVVETEGVYRITARFTVPATPAVAFAVLTDYETIPRVLPNVRTSRLLERTGRQALVEQQAVVRFMLFSTRIHLLLSVDESPESLRFVDRSGKSFERYEGAWTLCATETEGRLEITYELTAKPTFEAPAFMIRRLMQRDASDQIRRLRAEMAARAAKR